MASNPYPPIPKNGLSGTPEAPNNVFEIPLAALHQPYVPGLSFVRCIPANASEILPFVV
jgi:hypothetical protein